jgi:hypothetical protein
MPLPENPCSTLFTTEYKRLTEGGCTAIALGLLFWGLLLEAFFAFWLFDVGGFWKGKELLKENC